MILAIVGSREAGLRPTHPNEREKVERVIDAWVEKYGRPDRIVTGDAEGADAIAAAYARRNSIPCTVHVADWDAYGLSAGPKRNKLIVEDCTHMLAFPLVDPPVVGRSRGARGAHASKGTRGSIRLALAANREVLVVGRRARRLGTSSLRPFSPLGASITKNKAHPLTPFRGIPI
jgi:hypothetical protein